MLRNEGTTLLCKYCCTFCFLIIYISEEAEFNESANSVSLMSLRWSDFKIITHRLHDTILKLFKAEQGAKRGLISPGSPVVQRRKPATMINLCSVCGSAMIPVNSNKTVRAIKPGCEESALLLFAEVLRKAATSSLLIVNYFTMQ